MSALGDGDLGGAATQFGLINNLRTGNMILDMLVAMAIPLLFGMLGQWMRELFPMLRAFGAKVKNRHRVTRTITYERRMNMWGYCCGVQNSDDVLQKALMLYLSKHPRRAHEAATFTLTEKKEGGGARDSGGYESDGSDDCDESDGGTKLRKMEVSTMAPEGLEVDVGNGVKLMKTVDTSEDDGGKDSSGVRTETVTITLRAEGANAAARIEGYVGTAFNWYRNNVEARKDSSRYFFIMTRPKGGGDNGEGVDRRVYKRWAP